MVSTSDSRFLVTIITGGGFHKEARIPFLEEYFTFLVLNFLGYYIWVLLLSINYYKKITHKTKWSHNSSYVEWLNIYLTPKKIRACGIDEKIICQGCSQINPS